MGEKLTPQQQKAKQLIKETHEARVKDAAARWKDPSWKPPQDADKPAEDKAPHAAAQEIIKGNLAPGSHLYAISADQQANVEKNRSFYAWNAWNYIGSTSGRMKVYDSSPFPEYRFFSKKYRPNFFQAFPLSALGDEEEVISSNQQRVADLRAQAASTNSASEAEKIVYRKRYYNATSGIFFRQRGAEKKVKRLIKEGKRTKPYQRSRLVGCSLPYAWEAHHLLPSHFFYQHLAMKHIRLLLRSVYDINDGRNIMFLPTSGSRLDWKPHKLPYHLGSHPKYDKFLKKRFKDVKQLLANIKAKELPHPGSPGKIEAKLHDLEQDGWDEIVRMGSSGPSKLQ